MELIFSVVGYFVARVVLPLVTLGRVRAGPFAQANRTERRADGTVLLSPIASTAIGCLASIGALVLAAYVAGFIPPKPN